MPGPVSGQIVLFQPSSPGATVCEEHGFAFDMLNNGAEAIGETLVTLEMPCGFEYLAGTVSGLWEEDLSDLRRPVFRLDDWSPGEVVSVQLRSIISCQASDCLNGGELFSLQVIIRFGGNTQSFQSEDFNVQTPQLVIVGVQDQVMSGSKGQTLTRSFTIRNTRFGRLASFLFEDSFQQGIQVEVTQGEDEGSGVGKVRRRIDGTAFQTVGNKDPWLDFGEEITITETITIMACPQETSKAASEISVSWGCLGTYCQRLELPSILQIASGGHPGSAHEILSTLDIPGCKGDTLVPQMLILRDSSAHHDLLNVRFHLTCQGGSSFFLLDSIRATLNGTIYLPVSLDTVVTPCGKLASRFVYFEFPIIRSGEEVAVEWDYYFCKSQQCQSFPDNIEWQLFYEKSCAEPNDRFFTGRDFLSSTTSEKNLTGEMSVLPADLSELSDSTAFQLQIRALSPSLLESDNLLIIRFNLPCGVQILDSTMQIDGHSPIFKSISAVQGPAEILLHYLTPFPSGEVTLLVPAVFLCDTSCMDSPCEQVLVTSCPQNCMFESRSLLFESRVSVAANSPCNLEGLDFLCLDYRKPMTCFSGVCQDTLPGYFLFQSALQRTSLGLPDNNNDFKADEQGDLDFSLIRLDRIIPGDSLRIESSGRIVTDGRDTTFDHLAMTYSLSKVDQFQIDPLRALNETFKMIHPDSGFVNYENIITVYPAGLNTSFSVAVPGSFDWDANVYRVHVDLTAIKSENPAFPQDYRFGHLDSVRLVSFFLLAHNPATYAPFTNNSITLNIQTSANLFSGPEIPESDKSNCICRNVELEVGNLNYIIGRTAREFGLCQDTLENYNLFISLGSLPNFFPFEHRTTYDRLDPLFLPAMNFSIVNARLSMIHVNGSVIPVNIPLSIPPLANNGYLFPLDSLTQAFKEENLLIFLQFDLLSSVCQRPQGKPDPLETAMQLAPYPLRRSNRTITIRNNLLLAWPWTNLETEIALCDQTFLNNRAAWQLQITNCHADTMGLRGIPNLFLYPDYLPPSLADVGLTHLETGQPVPLTNGFFLLGPLAPCDTLRLELHGINQSCELEQIRFRLGWGCHPDAPDTEPCVEQAFTCAFAAASGLLELATDEKPVHGALCDTMPQTRILYLNADLGAAYQMRSIVHLPDGLEFVPGSASMRWPQETGPFVPLPDPIFLSDNRLAWELYTFLPTVDSGLPGVLSDPENGLELQFQTRTSCDFISGSRIIVTYEGQQACPRPTNRLARVSGPYHIQGVDAPYSTQISATAMPNGACGNQLHVDILVSTEALDNTEAKLELDLPPGFLLLPDSIQSNLFNPSPSWESGRWSWLLDTGLTVTSLRLVLQVADSAACVPAILPIFTSVPVLAWCAATDSLCSISVMTGNRFLSLQLARQDYVIRDLAPFFLQGERGIRADILQTGGSIPGSGLGELYLDLDGDGQLSPGDEWLMAQSFTIGSDSASTLTFFPLDLPREKWCQLMLVLDPQKNCLCAPVTGRLPGPVRLSHFETLELCWLGESSLGPSPQPGVNYQWQGNHLSCTDCALTTFTSPNPGSFHTFHTLLLTESWPGNCDLELEYLIRVEPKPGIIPPFQTICPGDSALLIATGGSAFHWEGPALSDNASSSVLAFPATSAMYVLLAEDALGCAARDTAFVEVTAFPVDAAGPDLQICAGADARLMAIQAPGYAYHWVNAGGRLDDPFRPDPLILVQQPFVFLLEIALGLCRQYDSVAVDFASSPFPGFLPDTMEVCLGDTLQLGLPTTHTYTWQPNFSGLCQNPACSEVSIPVLEIREFLVEATDSSGCISVHRLLLLPQADTAVTQFEIELCAGGQFILGSDTLQQPGTFCDTTVTSSGCIQVHCYQLAFSPIPSTILADTFCVGGFFIYMGDTLDQPGVYCDTIRDAGGCLEELCLELFMQPGETDTLPVTLCPGDYLVIQGDTLDQPGTYCFTYPGSGDCDSTVCLLVLQDSLPQVRLPFADTLICPGDTLWITPEIIPANADFQWLDGYPLLARPLFLEGTYILTIRDSCDQTTSVTVSIRFPEALMLSLGADTTLCEGDSLRVVPQVLGEDYAWMWLDGFPDWERSLSEEGLYAFQLTDLCGRVYLDTIALILESCSPCSLEIPNLFTPNGDGTNDVFRLITDCSLSEARMKIYNRWGQVVYDGHPVEPGWNGEFQGKAQPMEVYAYVITYSDQLDGRKILRGEVTLLR